MTPFLKWAGGKRWLASAGSHFFPTEYENYLEPFLGSGAIFFHLKPKSAFLSDTNARLVETYTAINSDHNKVYSGLKKHSLSHSEEYYYKVRGQKFRTPHTRAAQFIYLNRTCYNGLYRENKQGIFNVPKGSKANVLLGTDDFESVATALNDVNFFAGDFAKTIEKSKRGDFLFVDPPYTTAHNMNGFVKYNQNIFSWSDQERLHVELIKADLRGVQILMTNAAHESIFELYEGFGSVLELNRRSVISGLNKGRSTTSEYLIANYDLHAIRETKLRSLETSAQTTPNLPRDTAQPAPS